MVSLGVGVLLRKALGHKQTTAIAGSSKSRRARLRAEPRLLHLLIHGFARCSAARLWVLKEKCGGLNIWLAAMVFVACIAPTRRMVSLRTAFTRKREKPRQGWTRGSEAENGAGVKPRICGVPNSYKKGRTSILEASVLQYTSA